MVKANPDVRSAIKKAGLFQWQVADCFGLHDTNFSRLLRKELPPEKKERIFKIIEELREAQ